jgi:hypothetical protein
MKNITLSAEEHVIARARERARARQTTLNQLFRDWLAQVADEEVRSQQIDDLLTRLHYVQSGGKFSREELNER